MTSQHKNQTTLDGLLDATPLLRGNVVAGKAILINDKWHKVQAEAMVRKAVAAGRLTEEQAKSADYLYFEQPDGDLCSFAHIRNTPGLLLGTTIPRDAWWYANR